MFRAAMTNAATVVAEPHARPPGSRAVAIWLLICAALIFAMVIVGGVTRLTESGLSIMEWKPVTGTLPPLSEEAWRAEFEVYKQIPQYREMNAGMTLAEYKTIYWWEYLHRLLGRLIGVVFLLPFLWFLAAGRLRGRLAWQLGGVFVLGGLQGALGWYMVASGLVDRISVSPQRLTAHLTLALLIYAAVVWIALDLLRPRAQATAIDRRALAFAGLALLTIMSGGFVAGHDAGMIYNTFPLMDGHLIPEAYLDQGSWWVDAFENPASVQFHHRILGVTTAAMAFAYWLATRRAAGGYAHAVLIVALVQAGLGIATLLLYVPIPLAALHQAGAVALLTTALVAAHAGHGQPRS
jgi:cytochrome c oxidase assembly protein subunit 15